MVNSVIYDDNALWSKWIEKWYLIWWVFQNFCLMQAQYTRCVWRYSINCSFVTLPLKISRAIISSTVSIGKIKYLCPWIKVSLLTYVHPSSAHPQRYWFVRLLTLDLSNHTIYSFAILSCFLFHISLTNSSHFAAVFDICLLAISI